MTKSNIILRLNVVKFIEEKDFINITLLHQNL